VNRLQGARALDGVTLALLAARMEAGGDRVGAVAARVLAGRQLLQAAVLSRDPSSAALRAGMAVDGLHLLSMLALAALDGRRRGQALASASMEAMLIRATRSVIGRG
jgi:hypothetical protein